jgi:hypothetical protein
MAGVGHLQLVLAGVGQFYSFFAGIGQETQLTVAEVGQIMTAIGH